jgi:hypothetical protein
VFVQFARWLVPDHGNGSVYAAVHKTKVASHGNVIEPLEPYHRPIFSQLVNMDAFGSVKSVIQCLQSFESQRIPVRGSRVTAKGREQNSLNITQAPFGHGLKADVENHILPGKKFFHFIIKKNKYFGRDPIIGIREKRFDVSYSMQVLAHVVEQRLDQRGLTLLYIVNDSLGVDATVMRFHGLATLKKQRPQRVRPKSPFHLYGEIGILNTCGRLVREVLA